jgi:hypothetical protein
MLDAMVGTTLLAASTRSLAAPTAVVSLAVECRSETDEWHLDGSSLSLRQLESAQSRKRNAHDLVGDGLAALTSDAVGLSSTGVGDAVVARAGQFVLGPHAPRRKGLAIATALRAVHDVAIVDELAHPLNDHLVQGPGQSRGVGDAEQLMSRDDIRQIPRLDVVVEGDEEVEIVRRLVHVSMVPRASDVFGTTRTRSLRGGQTQVAGDAIAFAWDPPSRLRPRWRL